MADERRYRDEEIRRIFELATSRAAVGAPSPSGPDGLTLAELQDVGREVGLEPAQVARAAAVLDTHREALPRGTTLGLPTSVGRIVELPRAVTDREWELLVTEFRTTFRAKGRTASHGGIREWSNGNLHAFVEPTETGHRLRLTTFKSDAMGVNLAGGIFLMAAFLFFVVLLGKDALGAGFIVPVLFALMGGGALASNVVRLPRWATEREQQMEYIATRAKALISAPTDGDE